MKSAIERERGIVLVVTLCFTLILAIGAAAFLHLTKTHIVQVRLESHSAKAFYTAEVGMEKAIMLLQNDLYYTPEGVEPSWADAEVYTATGYIDLTQGGEISFPQYLDLQNPDYDGEFYPLVGESDYVLEGDGGHKSTYQIELSNVEGWTDRIWVKATGRYYGRNESGDGFVLQAERRVLAQLRAREISRWDNAIFAGVGQGGTVINGNAEIRGSVHILGTSLGSAEFAINLSGGGNVGNNYLGMPADLAVRVPSIAKSYGEEMLDSLEAEVRVQHGKVALSGSSCLGQPDVPGNGVKETLEGVYITDGYGGNTGEQNVYSDNGSRNPYDLDEFDLRFPRLSEPYAGYPSYMDYLRANALVISDAQQLNQLDDIKPSSVFNYSDAKGAIAMDGNGHMTIQGIVVVEGDVNFDKAGSDKIVDYQGKGTLVSATSVGINCNLLSRSFSTFPKLEILGVMAADCISFSSAQINVMGVFYAENQIVSLKQTSVAGTFLSNYFDMGVNVPAIYQVEDVVRNLPQGMIGGSPIWAIKRITWGEI